MTGTIYISHDPNLEEVLETAASKLETQGWRVIRGPKFPPGPPFMLSPQQRRDLLPEADIVVVSSRSRLTSEDIDAAPRLRAVIFPTIGVDAVDMAECERRGLIIGHGAMPENFLAMAESTVMLMLVLLYRLHVTERLLRENQPRPGRMYARMLRGSTIGVIGLGRIGGGVVERLRNWGADLIGYDPYLTVETAPAGVRLVELDVLLGSADVVSLHVPLNDETRNMIGQREIMKMKPKAILLNTARGGVVDESALVRAMEGGHLGGAGLDVFAEEPLPKDHPLRDREGVILTPHMLGHTTNLYDAMPDVLVDNSNRVMRGDLPRYTKNPEVESAWKRRLAQLA